MKAAYIRGLEAYAVKFAAGFHDNYRLGLPTGSGMMVMISSKTGFPQAVLLGNGYLTDVRTGAAGALASRHLARETIVTVGVIRSGVQARYQVRGIALVKANRSYSHGSSNVLTSSRVIGSAQCFRLGELHHALEEGVLVRESPVIELGELTLGRHPGRESNDQITVCDLTGVGVQDTSIARLAFQKALQKGLGTAFNA